MKLINYLHQEIKLAKPLLEDVDKIFDYQEVKKGTVLFKEGSKSQQVFFFEKGLARMFYQKDGKDITHFFFSEDMFCLSTQNIFLKERHFQNIEILEDSVLRVANFEVIENYLEVIPQINRLIFKEFSNYIQMLNHKIYGLQFQTAEERYLHLLIQHPKILQRVSLGHIASYLGITQQTLSVIRRETAKNK